MKKNSKSVSVHKTHWHLKKNTGAISNTRLQTEQNIICLRHYSDFSCDLTCNLLFMIHWIWDFGGYEINLWFVIIWSSLTSSYYDMSYIHSTSYQRDVYYYIYHISFPLILRRQYESMTCWDVWIFTKGTKSSCLSPSRSTSPTWSQKRWSFDQYSIQLWKRRRRSVSAVSTQVLTERNARYFDSHLSDQEYEVFFFFFDNVSSSWKSTSSTEKKKKKKKKKKKNVSRLHLHTEYRANLFAKIRDFFTTSWLVTTIWIR